jgi:hypothetical protein
MGTASLVPVGKSAGGYVKPINKLAIPENDFSVNHFWPPKVGGEAH